MNQKFGNSMEDWRQRKNHLRRQFTRISNSLQKGVHVLKLRNWQTNKRTSYCSKIRSATYELAQAHYLDLYKLMQAHTTETHGKLSTSMQTEETSRSQTDENERQRQTTTKKTVHIAAAIFKDYHHTHYNRFTALFPGLPGWACARTKTSGLHGARED